MINIVPKMHIILKHKGIAMKIFQAYDFSIRRRFSGVNFLGSGGRTKLLRRSTGLLKLVPNENRVISKLSS